jgi:hypothetical protein
MLALAQGYKQWNLAHILALKTTFLLTALVGDRNPQAKVIRTDLSLIQLG